MEVTVPKSLYEATVTLITKPHNDSTKKDNVTLISIINTDTKTLNKLLTNQIQELITNSMPQDEIDFISVMQR